MEAGRQGEGGNPEETITDSESHFIFLALPHYTLLSFLPIRSILPSAMMVSTIIISHYTFLFLLVRSIALLTMMSTS